MAGEADRKRASTRARCPICGRPTEPRLRPFCSSRCRDQDLLNWLTGSYAVPAVETDEDLAESRNDQDG